MTDNIFLHCIRKVRAEKGAVQGVSANRHTGRCEVGSDLMTEALCKGTGYRTFGSRFFNFKYFCMVSFFARLKSFGAAEYRYRFSSFRAEGSELAFYYGRNLRGAFFGKSKISFCVFAIKTSPQVGVSSLWMRPASIFFFPKTPAALGRSVKNQYKREFFSILRSGAVGIPRGL